MSFKHPIFPSFVSQNYEFFLFALLLIYTFSTADFAACSILAAGAALWLLLSRLLPNVCKEPSEREKKLAAGFSKYKTYSYYAIVVLFALFLALKSSATMSMLLLVLIGLAMFFIVLCESFAGYLEGGLRNEAREVVLAILWALCIWFSIGFLLGTKVPFNGVVSCSMVPSFERGDLLLLQADSGENSIALSQEDFDSLTSVATVSYAGSIYSFNGSIFSYCVAHPAEGICMEFSKNAPAFYEMHGPLKFSYGYCERIAKGSGSLVSREVCVKGISYNSKPLAPTADVAVYEPNKGDLFSYSGDIVHRIVARFSHGNMTKYVTKGDNNPVADMQVYDYAHSLGNSPFPSKSVKGTVALRLPYLGFFKLALSSPLNPALAMAVENCESYYKN